MIEFLGWIDYCLYRDQIYSEGPRRIESLDGHPHAEDLAYIGAYNNDWYHDTCYVCYKCPFIFDVVDILRFSHHEGVDFRTAGLLKHARANPSCDFIRQLPKDWHTTILGRCDYRYQK